MKKDIHPEIFTVDATCTCGYSLVTTSTQPTITMTICSQCHPFFTGQQKFVDTAGRIEKFKKRYEKFGAPDAASKK